MKTAAKPRSTTWEAFSRGEHLIWLCGAALALCLLMIVGLLLVVAVNGLGVFWPHRLTEADHKDGKPVLGIVVRSEDFKRSTGTNGPVESLVRSQFKVGNRDLYGLDFRWVDHRDLSPWREPAAAVVLEREEYGDFLGYLAALKSDGKEVATNDAAWVRLMEVHPEARRIAAERTRVRKIEMGRVNRAIQEARTKIKRAESRLKAGADRDAAVADAQKEIARANEEFERLKAKAEQLQRDGVRWVAVMRTADGKVKEVPVVDIVRAYRPNNMTLPRRIGVYCGKLWEYVSGEPRESNTEGGIFPAIFGTVLMTLLMSVAVVPFGVLAALYLREYAKQGFFVRMVRIAVNNLAGVPSIVFGVFGLGFFVYFVGGSIDQLFFHDALPNPTFGTGGILWASLTLALLTVPVVIVATEESIAAVPRGAKEGSLALGASKFQTLLRIVLPASLPGILTGLILAMARGAGEVAPLMITGVVKMAPDLPLDGQFPFLHFDRKFMHLGFHIFDVGFQSPNVEAAKPMVFTTTLLLLAVVVALNMVAIVLRDRIRKRYQTGAFA